MGQLDICFLISLTLISPSKLMH